MKMQGVSTTRKLGIAARVAGRVISQQAGRSRTLGALTNAGRATATHCGRVLGQLWLEVTGFVFLALAGDRNPCLRARVQQVSGWSRNLEPSHAGDMFCWPVRMVRRKLVLEDPKKKSEPLTTLRLRSGQAPNTKVHKVKIIYLNQ